MGILGPTFKGEVGDVIRVHLKNDPFPQCTLGSPECQPADTCAQSCNLRVPSELIEGTGIEPGIIVPGLETGGIANFIQDMFNLPFSLHPHGVWYNKDSEVRGGGGVAGWVGWLAGWVRLPGRREPGGGGGGAASLQGEEGLRPTL